MNWSVWLPSCLCFTIVHWRGARLRGFSREAEIPNYENQTASLAEAVIRDEWLGGITNTKAYRNVLSFLRRFQSCASRSDRLGKHSPGLQVCKES